MTRLDYLLLSALCFRLCWHCLRVVYLEFRLNRRIKRLSPEAYEIIYGDHK